MKQNACFSFKRIFLTLLLALVILGGIFYPEIRNNIHTVIPNQVYRSAELSSGKLSDVVQKYHIKSIFNLRGAHPNDLWYQKEIDIAEKNQIQFYNWSLPAHKMPTPEELQRLIQALESAPKPILIHCKNGADRSGLISAFAILLFETDNLAKANQQISFWYLAFSPNSVGRLVMPKYEAWLEKNRLNSSPKNLRTWIYSPHPLD